MGAVLMFLDAIVRLCLKYQDDVMCNVQKRWAQKEKEMREQMKKLKSGPSPSEYSSFHGKEMLYGIELVQVFSQNVFMCC